MASTRTPLALLPILPFILCLCLLVPCVALAAVTVTVSPTSVSIDPGAQQQFSAHVSGATSQVVIWNLSGPGCVGITCGQITGSGLYTAPVAIPIPNQVIVRATPLADASQSASATVSINTPILVSVTPQTAQLMTGAKQQFTASVTGTTSTGVTWRVSGGSCSGAACGTVTSSGLYTAPASVPASPLVLVTATSTADPTKSASASVVIQAAVSVSISPSSATVVITKTRQFTATVTGSLNTAVAWSLSGPGCAGAACGSITSAGLYKAPGQVPSPPTISVKAQSQADPSKSATATVTVAPAVAVSIAPAAVTLATSATQQFTATVTGTSNTAVTWSLSGAGCSGNTCGSISAAGLYAAPPNVPTPPSVTVTAKSQADATKSASATVTVVAPFSVTVSPATVRVSLGSQQKFTATVIGTTNKTVTWSVTGASCTGVACGKVDANGLYTAPSAMPPSPTVSVVATSNADPTKSGSAVVTLAPAVTVAVSPATATLLLGAQQQFTATVTGATNTAVTWKVAGIGCTGTSCGAINGAGLYTAPSALPSPATVSVTATSVADSTKSATATVSLTTPVTISISPISASVATGAQKQFTSTVAGSGNTAVTWRVSGNGCSGVACGTISTTGLYTAPASVPTPPTVSIKATAQADPSKTAIATVTITLAVSVSVTPPAARVAVGGTLQFNSHVTGTPNTAVTWKVTGPNCTPARCGTITGAGLYTAPAEVPSPPTVQVTATSAANSTRFASSSITLVASNSGKLNGPYVFLFQGIDSNGSYHAAGSFVADGNGNLLNGVEDINRTSGVLKALPFTGSYTMEDDNRGTFSIHTTVGTSNYSFALGSTGQAARFISIDSSDIHGAGILRAQVAPSGPTSVFNGIYVTSLTGTNAGRGRLAAIGVLLLDGAGRINGSAMDVNDSGTVYPTFVNFPGTYSVDSQGHGTLILSLPGFAGGTFHFSTYAVSTSAMFMISTDPLTIATPLFSGQIEQQSSAPFSSSALQGPTILNMAGFSGGFRSTTIGEVTFDGNSTFNGTFDQNHGGVVSRLGVLKGAFNTSLNGRTTIDISKGPVDGPFRLTAYVVSPNSAVVMDTSAAVNFGRLNPQVAFPFVGNETLRGSYTIGTTAPVTSPTSLTAGTASFDGAGHFSAIEDVSPTSGGLLNVNLSGTYSLSTALDGVRGIVSVTSPTPQTFVMWLLSPEEFVLMNVDVTSTAPSALDGSQ